MQADLSTRKEYVIKTLGCKANLSDSQEIEEELRRNGWVPANGESSSDEDRCDSVKLCIVNSCTVTNEADRQSRKMASRLAREYPQARIVFTGCSAEVGPEGISSVSGIDYVVGNQNKKKLVKMVLERGGEFKAHSTPKTPEVLGSVRSYGELRSQHPMDREWPAMEPVALQREGAHQTRTTRAFLKIQEGCNSFCTYCIIPYGRGPSRSLSPTQIVEQVAHLVKQGVREMVLTGTNIGDYGVDLGQERAVGFCPLTSLIKKIFKETTLERLRLSSLDPTEISSELLSLMRDEPRLCRHFHVSLQSPLTKILRLMKRRYSQVEVERTLHAIKELNYTHSNGHFAQQSGPIYVGMDVITGFPGETEEDFELTLRVLESLPWTRLHVFPYSEREGTPAKRLGGSVPNRVRAERARVLNALSLKRQTEWARSLVEAGALLKDVLVESSGTEGLSGNYVRVGLNSEKPLSSNSLVSCRLNDFAQQTAAHEVVLVGKVI